MLVSGLSAAPARAAESGPAAGERIADFEVDLVVDAEGVLHVTEEITYDFGRAADRHGLLRHIPVRTRHDDEHDRLYDIGGFTAESPTAPDTLSVEPAGAQVTLRVGDADRNVTGTHLYVLQYQVRGALDRRDGDDVLAWNAVGNEWTVPVARASVDLEMPADLTRLACFTGYSGATGRCAEVSREGSSARIGAGSLAEGEGVTVLAAISPGAVPTPDPVLVERWTLARGFAATPATGGGALLLGALCAAGLTALARRGRDDHHGLPDVGGGVSVRPPDGVSPALLGVVTDERAGLDDVKAALVDLAVRGHIRIDEFVGVDGRPDYQIVRLRGPGGLAGYEAMLLDRMFAMGFSGNLVRLTDLDQKFTPVLSAVKQSMYDEVVTRGWFKSRPDRARTSAYVVGGLATVGALVITCVLAVSTNAGLLGLPLLAGAVGILFVAPHRPARTAEGARLKAEADRFRAWMRSAAGDPLAPAGGGPFERYLPYAVAFGLAAGWTQTFATRADAPTGFGWWTSPYPFHLSTFGHGFERFGAATSEKMTSVPPSSSGGSGGGGGSSGGGGGGGGGGSW